MDSSRRTLVKAMIWNLMGLGIMVLVGFAATGSFRLGGAIAIANTAIGICCYVIYERIWGRIRWGRHG